ncbi:MAG: hypothetical protein GOVbin3264_7 [Prokaryotic dsDNA virus sp.]|nr:MAG: hypothetical protein GOVbin3264_7 [Prokaryotic dsDNA virus sp.]|tara:strand:- start:3151 stop:5220 length:2070 start_codon:yes stop_codon:yes gene_type:complete
MAENVELNLILKGGAKSVKTIGELEKGLEQAREEIKGLERGSEDFNKLATAIQQASSEVKTLEKQMEGLEPQQKAEAFLKMGEGIAGGFMAAQGAMGLLGVESEQLEQIQVKVQSAIAIAMGVRMISEAALMASTAKRVLIEKAAAVQTGVLTGVTKVKTGVTIAAAGAQKLLSFAIGTSAAALKVLKLAIAATGIGALVVGVVALVGALKRSRTASSQQKAALEAQTQANKDLLKSIEDKTKALDKKISQSATDTQLQLAINNATDEQSKIIAKNNKTIEINNRAIQANREYISQNKEAIKTKTENIERYNKAIAEGRDVTDAFTEQVERNKKEIIEAQGYIDKQTKLITKQLKKVNELTIANDKQAQIIDLLAKKKQLEEKIASENAAKAKERAQRRKDEAAELLALTQEVTLLMIEDEDERAEESLKIQRKNDLAKVKNHRNRKLMEQKINEKYDALEKQSVKEQQRVDEENWEAFRKKLEQITGQVLKSEKEMEILAVKEKYAELEKEADRHNYNMTEAKEVMEKELADIEKKYKDQKDADDKERAETEIGYRQQIMANYFQASKDFAGDNQKLQKGIAVAETIYNTQAAIMAAIRQIPPPFGIPTAISVGVMGAAAVKNILTESMGGIGDVEDPSTPDAMVPSATGAFTLGGALEQEPVKAYVVTDEMTDSQEQLSDIRRRATI